MNNFRLLLLLLLWIPFSFSFGKDSEPVAPNILFLFADDLGWVDTSVGALCLGNESRFYETPHLERLAAEGMVFTHAYAQQNCMPTRVAFLSGQYAPANDVYNVGSLRRPFPEEEGKTPIVPPEQRTNLDPASVSLAEHLQKAGYVTAYLGKTHGVEPAENLSENHGFLYNHSAQKRFKFEWKGDGWKAVYRHDYLAIEGEQGNWHFPDTYYQRYAAPYDREYVEKHLLPVANGNDPQRLIRNPKHPQPKHLTDAMTDAAEDFIAEQTGAESPFFLQLSYHLVHSLFVVRPDLEEKYYKKPGTDPRHTFVTYAAMVEMLDQSVGRILNALEDPNGDGNPEDSILGNTLVVFYSDNGGSDSTSNAPLRGRKGMFYEGGIRVPLIIRYPQMVEPGSVSDVPVHAIDFYPTFSEIADASLPNPAQHSLDGVSLVPLLQGDSEWDRDSLYFHFPGYMDERQRPNSAVISRIAQETYKLFYFYETGHYELYNLTKDLGEKHNLLLENPGPEQRRIAERMSSDLRTWLQKSGAKMGTWRETGDPVSYPSLYL